MRATSYNTNYNIKQEYRKASSNFTQTNQRRIGLSVGVDYESNLQEVESIAISALKDLPGIIEDPAPFFMVDSFGDSAINTTLYYWYDTKNQGLSDMTNVGAVALKRAFDQAGINIPYPIRVVQLNQEG